MTARLRSRIHLSAVAVLGAAAMLIARPAGAAAQNVLLERGVQAAGVWCFPLASDTLSYLYIPDRARLATDDEGRPKFSFVRYVTNERAATASNETIGDAEGGGILTFLVSYGVSEDRRRRAERELTRVIGNRDVTLKGPLIFQSGTFNLVSAVLGEDGDQARHAVLTTGAAPVLEGNRIALSFELDPERSTLLLQSLQTATPDVSLVFDMSFVGIAPAFDATLTVDWAKVQRHKEFSAGGSVYWVGADIETAFDEMRRDNAIQLTSTGSDDAMEALLSTVYDRLLTLMFEPVQPMKLPESERGGLMDALSQFMDPEKLSDMARETTGFGLGVGYKARTVRDTGHTVLRFDHRAALERHATITFNVGDVWKEWGDDTAVFRTVNLADPAFQQREIRVGVDGALLPEFDKYVNSVSVTLKKAHEDGSQTLRELVLDGASFGGAPPDLGFVYGWSGDDDRERWLTYQYRTQWSFRDGGSYDTGWVDSDESMINLYAPYDRRVVQLVGDYERLRDRGVRAVFVEISYPFFGERRSQDRIIRIDRPPEEATIEATLPRDEPVYDYEITWHVSGEDDLTADGTDRTGIVYIDELPQPDDNPSED
ncbi:MAG: hypothetical protein PVF05_13005 [Gemmatimonadales bacterium]